MKKLSTCLLLLFTFLLSQSATAQCDPPSIIWDEDGLIINWIAKDGATSHIIRYRETGTFTWSEEEVEDQTFFDISFLDNCVTYDFRVRTVCGDDESSYTPVYQAAANCGTCYAEYCEIPLLNDGITFLSFLRVDDYENETTFTGTGYEDFRGAPDIVLPPGVETEIELRMGEGGFFYENRVLAYVDFNRDGEFSPDEEIVDEQIFDMVPLVTTFDVPPNINFGITRMRVMIYSNPYNGIDICESPVNPFWGEVEEYCVILGEIPSACDFDFQAELTEVTSGSATFEWEELSAASAYNFRYKKTSEPETEWTELATIDPIGFCSNLDDCTEYEFEVRGVCPFDTSSYKNNTVFNSFCSTNIDQDEFLITEISTFPNPWATSLNLEFVTKRATELTITAIDTDGRQFELVSNQQASIGKNQFSISNTDQLLAGVYILRITNEENRNWYHKTLKIK